VTAYVRNFRGSDRNRSRTDWDNLGDRAIRERFLRDPIRGVNHPSRIFVRDWLRAHPGLTLLDIPCGPGVEYEGFRAEDVPVEYIGMDLTESMRQGFKARFPEADVRSGDILDIALPDDAVDVVLVRHIFEHLEDWHMALVEALRVSRQYVLIVLFKLPTHREIKRIAPHTWENRIDWRELERLLRATGAEFTRTQLPYLDRSVLPPHVEENTVVEVRVPR
jgi:ubiquinone/menaquinone biosynthesis C-methylase UbiE